MVMKKHPKKKPEKPLRVAELKTHLSAYLKRVRDGETLIVHDRDTPIARIEPIRKSRLTIREPTKRWEDFVWPKGPIGTGPDIVETLLELRRDKLDDLVP